VKKLRCIVGWLRFNISPTGSRSSSILCGGDIATKGNAGDADH